MREESAVHKINERISIKVKQEEATDRREKGKKGASKGKIRSNGEKERTQNDCFYLIRVHRTRLLHLNMITSHKAISKVVCGKLVRGN